MRRKTRAVAGNLAALKAETAHRIADDGEVVVVPSAALSAGRPAAGPPGRAHCRPTASCSPAPPRSTRAWSPARPSAARSRPAPSLYAGSTNFSGALTLRVTAAGAGTLIDEVERLLDKAVAARSRYLRLADRAARLYAPMVHATAALTAVGWLVAGASLHDAVVTAIAVLIITCPCALALAIPAVQVVASGALFRRGIILNAGDAIERLAEIDTVVFDKTGTLTLPEPRVANARDRARSARDAPPGSRCRAAIRSPSRSRARRGSAGRSTARSRSRGRACAP